LQALLDVQAIRVLRAIRVVLAIRVVQATQECCGPCGLSCNKGVAANRHFRLVRAKPKETLSGALCFPFGLAEDILHAINHRVK
jgi:hypothetical protein